MSDEEETDVMQFSAQASCRYCFDRLSHPQQSSRNCPLRQLFEGDQSTSTTTGGVTQDIDPHLLRCENCRRRIDVAGERRHPSIHVKGCVLTSHDLRSGKLAIRAGRCGDISRQLSDGDIRAFIVCTDCRTYLTKPTVTAADWRWRWAATFWELLKYRRFECGSTLWRALDPSIRRLWEGAPEFIVQDGHARDTRLQVMMEDASLSHHFRDVTEEYNFFMARKRAGRAGAIIDSLNDHAMPEHVCGLGCNFFLDEACWVPFEHILDVIDLKYVSPAINIYQRFSVGLRPDYFTSGPHPLLKYWTAMPPLHYLPTKGLCIGMCPLHQKGGVSAVHVPRPPVPDVTEVPGIDRLAAARVSPCVQKAGRLRFNSHSSHMVELSGGYRGLRSFNITKRNRWNIIDPSGRFEEIERIVLNYRQDLLFYHESRRILPRYMISEMRQFLDATERDMTHAKVNRCAGTGMYVPAECAATKWKHMVMASSEPSVSLDHHTAAGAQQQAPAPQAASPQLAQGGQMKPKPDKTRPLLISQFIDRHGLRPQAMPYLPIGDGVLTTFLRIALTIPSVYNGIVKGCDAVNPQSVRHNIASVLRRVLAYRGKKGIAGFMERQGHVIGTLLGSLPLICNGAGQQFPSLRRRGVGVLCRDITDAAWVPWDNTSDPVRTRLAPVCSASVEATLSQLRQSDSSASGTDFSAPPLIVLTNDSFPNTAAFRPSAPATDIRVLEQDYELRLLGAIDTSQGDRQLPRAVQTAIGGPVSHYGTRHLVRWGGLQCGWWTETLGSSQDGDGTVENSEVDKLYDEDEEREAFQRMSREWHVAVYARKTSVDLERINNEFKQFTGGQESLQCSEHGLYLITDNPKKTELLC
ncbi:unnamed protein product [Vitrella brassicaformis CCMP3155]|uniref:Uncharacterized protein n=2 Tax=Vitrella brassicaformis TaxID=1169539 RepID=A0A0G4GEG6_VITBC|nr:unnamed protein product [Vitrella brassicaformis CCMP3155]|eukprot:CEM27767.1 unnamed protein product [Vitrella brassicaformis CCMP3155]